MNLSALNIRKVSLASFFAVILGILLLTALAPAEKTLGGNARIVYLHGAWVWAALITILAAAVAGLVALVTRQMELHYWSRALGRVGTLFWITFLPMSLIAMETNWNGLFLAEPRWRMAFVFAVTGILLQLGLSLLEPIWSSICNLAYGGALLFSILGAENVMHPASPIRNSSSIAIQLFFISLLGMILLLAGLVTSWLLKLEFSRSKG